MGPDRDIARLARRQHGVITTAQLHAAGLSRDAIRHRVQTGRLAPLHRGVYLASSLPAQFTPEMAAVLACGPHAALSHTSAAALWQIRPHRPGPIHVSTPRQVRPRHGVIAHRTRTVEATRQHGIPLTTPGQTLRDLATLLPRHELDRAREEAVVRRLVAATPDADAALTRSEAERRLLDLIRLADLPAPLTNTRVEGFEVDVAWPEQRLIVEVDGFAFHGTRAAFERDRLRDQALQAAGWRVMRVTWRQLAEAPEAVVARIAAALALSPRPVPRPSSAPARTAALGHR